MAAIVTTKFRIYAAQKFISGLSDNLSNNNIYVFIGKTLPWTDDNIPDIPTDVVLDHINNWTKIFHLKRLSASNCSLVIPRYNWISGTVYQEYDDSIDLFDPELALKPFYIITDEFNVYKCLYNFGNSPSFVKPTGTSIKVISTADKYQWKFMFNVNSADAQRFLTDQWIPVKELLISDGSKQFDVQQAAIPGIIDIIKVIDGGSGYVSAPNITITGDGINATAISEIKNGKIININITNKGSGYNNAVVVAESGQITSILLTNPGSNYVSPPNISFEGGSGSGAEAICTISNGAIDLITITKAGSGYVTIPSVIFNAGDATANAIISGGSELRAIISPPGGHGSDPVSELGGFFALMNVQLAYNEGGFNVNNDFRKIGLILNPKKWNSNLFATATTYIQAYSLYLSDVTGSSFEPDEMVVGDVSGAIGVVLDYNVDTSILRLVDTEGIFWPGENVSNVGSTKTGLLEIVNGTANGGGAGQITLDPADTSPLNLYVGYTIRIIDGKGTGQQRIITSVVLDGSDKNAHISVDWDTTPDGTSEYSIAKITYPDLKPNTGYILYIENRRPITRSSDQLEDIKIICEF